MPKDMIANVAGARKIPALRTVISKFRPHIIRLSEAYNCEQYLRLICTLENYQLRHYTESTNKESRSVAVLFRDDVEVENDDPVSMTEYWKFKRSLRNPRVYQKGRVWIPTRNARTLWRKVFTQMRYAAVHFPPYGVDGGRGGKNKPAYAESLTWAKEWGDNWPILPALLGGDLNEEMPILRSELKNSAFTNFVKGGKVDHWLANRYIKVKRVKSLRKYQPKGMHGWFILYYDFKE